MMNFLKNDSDSKSDDERPPTPREEDCCGQGCTPCIFDIHKKLLEEWENKKSNKKPITASDNYLSQLKYKRFFVKGIAEASEDSLYVEVRTEGIHLGFSVQTIYFF